MKPIKLVLLCTLLGVSGLASAAEPQADTTREQRMSEALDKYHDSRNANPGPAARAEESIKRGASKTGHAIKRGAHKTADAVKHGAHKTGEAMHRVGEKIKGKDQPAP
jgi:hypothetical protein